jgi:hypothetical protein
MDADSRFSSVEGPRGGVGRVLPAKRLIQPRFSSVVIRPRANVKTGPPHFLLDALTESIISGTFIDTKFYIFSRRDASGRVGSPRSLYCNSRVLNTVPYFSTRK